MANDRICLLEKLDNMSKTQTTELSYFYVFPAPFQKIFVKESGENTKWN